MTLRRSGGTLPEVYSVRSLFGNFRVQVGRGSEKFCAEAGTQPGLADWPGGSLGAAQNLTQENRQQRKDCINNGRVHHCTGNQNNL